MGVDLLAEMRCLTMECSMRIWLSPATSMASTWTSVQVSAWNVMFTEMCSLSPASSSHRDGQVSETHAEGGQVGGNGDDALSRTSARHMQYPMTDGAGHVRQ